MEIVIELSGEQQALLGRQASELRTSREELAAIFIGIGLAKNERMLPKIDKRKTATVSQFKRRKSDV